MSIDTPFADDAGIEAPAPIARDERRMQVRAYNAWAGLLGEREIPRIADLDPASVEFAPQAVLLEVSGGSASAAIRWLGARLADECDATGALRSLDEAPGGSLLARVTEHLDRVIADRAPLGFEAEHVNPRGATIVYRGILLPFAGDCGTVDFVYAVINWKELVDGPTTATLLREIGGALAAPGPIARREDRLTVWADGPAGAGSEAGPADMAAERACNERLRRLPHTSFAALGAEGREFALLVARRLPSGEVVLLGEVAADCELLERAAQAMLAPGVR
ncbi:MAG: hypothetical protein ABW194_04920 [Novosphingobium sp.]